MSVVDLLCGAISASVYSALSTSLLSSRMLNLYCHRVLESYLWSTFDIQGVGFNWRAGGGL